MEPEPGEGFVVSFAESYTENRSALVGFLDPDYFLLRDPGRHSDPDQSKRILFSLKDNG